MVIREFKNEYDWLSNFYPCDILYNGEHYSSAEAAFQAQKCVDEEEKNMFLTLTASQAKKFGKKVKLREDWEQVKESIMYEILLVKFTTNTTLKNKLLETDNAYLIEGNYWKDTYWGVCPPNGEILKNGLNRLGELLMKVRTELQN